MNHKVTTGLRIFFGLFCLFFGINKFVGFLEFPPIPGDGGTLLSIYASSGFLKIIGVLEILGGIALLIGRYVPMALIVMIAIMLNAAVFHALHDPGAIAGALVGLVMSLVLLYAYKTRFLSILSS